MLEAIRGEVIKLTERLALQDGLVHTQFLVDGDQFWFVEVTRRCPGDLYSQLIELSTGFPYCEAYARPFIDQAMVESPKALQRNWITRHTVSLPYEQHLESVEFRSPVRIVKWVPLAVAGDLVRPSPFSRIALLFSESESRADQDRLFAQMLKRELYEIRPLLKGRSNVSDTLREGLP
jgi:hypothetical protein